MQEKHLFEYAVIRIVPRVEREEFINVGVILFCSPKGYLKTLYELNKDRLMVLSGDLDFEELEERLQAFTKICAGDKEGGSIGQLPLSSRFRWLTSTRSTIVQISPVHPGLCDDPGATLEKLFEKLVRIRFN